MLTLKLTYLGVFQIEVNGQPIPNFRTEKTAALLAYLVLEGHSTIPRNQLTELLWSGYEKKRPRRVYVLPWPIYGRYLPQQSQLRQAISTSSSTAPLSLSGVMWLS